MLIPKGAIARAAGPEPGGPQPPVRTDDLGSAVLIVGAISVSVTTIALALRLWARAQSNKWSFWWDDWILIVTTLFSHGFLALNMAWTRLGLGKHVENIDMASLLPTIYMSKASILMYAICIYLIKVSALLLYARVFNRSKKFRLVLRWLGGAVTAWFLCTALVPWFNCNPIRKTIDPFVPGVCFDRMDWFLASAFINAAIDLTILIMPLQQVWKLQMTTRRKIQVTLVFILGYWYAVASWSVS
ncbi:hypothetical protein PG993_002553 [Apiospora rasikravindrae]|uniref:Rhodopsin domain-containing protein n=1 Tax=Apiospora rasikravindrae TaxID=990691 RepID=A0ABR1TZL3_9PEZI